MKRRVPWGAPPNPVKSTDVVDDPPAVHLDDESMEYSTGTNPAGTAYSGIVSSVSSGWSGFIQVVIGLIAVVSLAGTVLAIGYMAYNQVVITKISGVTDDLPKIYSGVQSVGPAQPFDVGDRGTVIAIYPPVFDNSTVFNNEPYVVSQSAPGLPYSSVIQGIAPILVQNNTAIIRLASPYVASNVSYPSSLVIDEHGLVVSFASGSPPITDASGLTYLNTTLGNALDAPFITTGPSVFPNGHVLSATNGISATILPGSISIQLIPTTVVPGSYSRTDITVDANGRIAAAASTPAPTSSDIPTTTNGTVQQALNSNILVTAPAPHLPGHRLFSPNPIDFLFNDDAANGTYSLGILPGPLASVTCATPSSIHWGTNGFGASCISAPTPGTANGYATLDATGVIYMNQLPAMFFDGPTFRGLWNASGNNPLLLNTTCGFNGSFYFVVSDSGNTTLGDHNEWLELDWVVCFNGTWDQLRTPEHIDVSSFNGRSGIVFPQLGDYDANLISIGTPHNLANMVAYPFVVAGPAPGLPNAQLLAGTAGEITVSGPIVGLSAKPAFPLLSNIFPSFMCNVDVDHNGRLSAATACTAVQTTTGTINEVIITGTASNPIFGLPQPIAPTSSPTFATPTVTSLVVGTKTVTASGAGTVTIPAVGTADFILTEGSQLINGLKSFGSAPIVRSGFGVALNNAADTFRQILQPATGLALDLTIRFPPNAGSSGFVMSTDGLGNLAWVSNTAGSVTSVSATSPLSSTGGTNPVVSISNTPVFGTVTGTSGVIIGSTTLTGAGSYTIALPPAAPVTGNVLIASSPTTLDYSDGKLIFRPYTFTTSLALGNVPVAGLSMWNTVGNGSLTIPANSLLPNDIFEFSLDGQVTVVAGGIVISVRYGATIIATATVAGTNTLTTFTMSGRLIVVSTGATGSMKASATFLRSVGVVVRAISMTPVTVNTLNPNAFSVFFGHSTSNAGNTCTVSFGILKKL